MYYFLLERVDGVDGPPPGVDATRRFGLLSQAEARARFLARQGRTIVLMGAIRGVGDEAPEQLRVYAAGA